MRLKEYWKRCQVAANEILTNLEIPPPRCGFHIGLGWMPLVKEALEKMVEAGWDKDLQQVKQKFCGLKIYIGQTNNEIDSIIRDAEEKASKSCENCGKSHGLVIPKSGRAFCKDCVMEPEC